VVAEPYSVGLLINISMIRPMCLSCNQRFRAVAYHTENKTQYRKLCDHCIRRKKKIPTPEALWKRAGYKKKATCDRCGFKSRYASQLLVYHVDGNMKNTTLTNLRTICLNCVEEVKRMDLPWAQGDLQVDR